MIGQTVSHYEILERIGGGGMGVVYRARDLKLDRLVALKFLPFELSRHEDQKQRFIQEAKAASALDHPNICTIHAIEETEDGQMFIAMAYYEGETVEDMVGRGPLPVGEIVELALQVANGLAAAHDRGIVHRDIKPANLILSHDGTVKILDFGLSKFLSRPSDLTEADTLLGSAAYMSPEQVQGEPIGPQTDVWALGVVLYEMATGERPFESANRMSLLYAIAHREPEAPIEKVPALSPDLDAIIRRCLGKSKEDRYPDMDGLTADLTSYAEMTDSVSMIPSASRSWIFRRPSVEVPRRMPTRHLVLGLIAFVLISVLVGVFLSRNPHLLGPEAAEGPGEDAGIVAAGFRDTSATEATGWLGAALCELLVFEFSDASVLHWSHGQRTSCDDLAVSAAADKTFDPEHGFDRATLEKIRQQDANLSLVIGGTYQVTLDEQGEGSVRIDVLVQETKQEKPIALHSFEGRTVEVVQMVTRLADQLAGTLGLGSRSRPRVSDPPPQLDPQDPEATRLLAEARERLRLLDAGTARQLLEQAIEIEPRNPVLHDRLAAALAELGYHQEMVREAQLAMETAQGHPRIPQIFFRARWLESQDRWSTAAALLQVLQPYWPATSEQADPLRKLDAELHLAFTQARAGRARDALETLRPLRALYPEEPRVALAEAEAARKHSEYREQLGSARRAAALANGLDAPWQIAQARLLEGLALRRLGELDGAVTALAAARQLFAEAANRRGEVHALNTLGNVQWDQQNLLKAKASYEEAARLSETIGNTPVQARMLLNKALVLRELGDLRVAREVFQEGLPLLRQADDRLGIILALSNLAETTYTLGHFEEASKAFAESMSLLETIERPDVESFVLASYGGYLAQCGDLAKAQRLIDQAIEIQDRIGDHATAATSNLKLARLLQQRGDLDQALAVYERLAAYYKDSGNLSTGYAVALQGQGEVLLAHGKLDLARQRFDEAVAIQGTAMSPHLAAETRLSVARLRLAEGRLEAAENLAREALAVLTSSHTVLSTAKAQEVLATVLLEAGRLDEAQAQISNGLAVLEGVPSLTHRLPLEMTRGRILAASGHIDAAKDLLQHVLAEATTARFAGVELAARLGLGEIELESGSETAGLLRLRAVEEEATSKGFVLLAERARRSER